ncbi:hypothetical protein KCU84_g307, partial [Aureobasidium melanogenum]
MVLQATSCNPEELPKPSRALLSSVFLAAVESLSDEDCLNLMMLPKDECVRNLFVMTKDCLVDANFMEVATTENLQALVLYLVAARQHSTPQSLWTVIGVAVRLAHRLGIHREKNLQGMTVFAAEMNRRLWWQLHLLNRHYVNLCEDIESSDPAHILIFDTKRPLNLNEADLHPDMTTLPSEREAELRPSSSWKLVLRKSMPDIVTAQYRYNASPDALSERLDIVSLFVIVIQALLLLQTQHSSCASQILDRYRWHTKLFYCFEALFPVLHTLAFGEPSESTGSEAWKQVSLAYHYNPELLDWEQKSFYSNYCRNLNSLVLRAWSRRASTTDHVPNFVQQIQLQESRPTGQDNAGISSANEQQSAQLTQRFDGELSSGQHITSENPEIDGQTWEYWLNMFDNEELLGI